MIFRNTFRLLFSNFSNVWKLLLYYFICFSITALVCSGFIMPIINELARDGILTKLWDIISNFFVIGPEASLVALHEVIVQTIAILSDNLTLKFFSIFTIIWLFLVFPITLDMAKIALGEVIYGYMTSQVKYSFTGRYVKNIGKGISYSALKYAVQLVFRALNIGVIVCFFQFLIKGGGYVFLAMLVFALLLLLVALKRTLFSCWMPAICVLSEDAFSSLATNFKTSFRNFFVIFSNMLVLEIVAIVFNLIFGVFTATVSLIITLPITVFVFAIAEMTSFFSSRGMRFYVYPDMFISPKKFEEQDSISRIKNLI